MRQAKTQKRNDLFASALDPNRCRVTQWPTSTGVKLAASVFGLDASTRTFHSGGFASFRWRRVVTMIYAASASGALLCRCSRFCSLMSESYFGAAQCRSDGERWRRPMIWRSGAVNRRATVRKCVLRLARRPQLLRDLIRVLSRSLPNDCSSYTHYAKRTPKKSTVT